MNSILKNIGTLAYAAPEQIKQNNYDQKADIYSLGLILFELAFPMKTNMERNTHFDNIKKGKVSDNIKSQSPIISRLISLMVNENPEMRPKAFEIISAINEYLLQKDKMTSKLQLSEISNNGLSPKNSTSRKRFFSEDIQKLKSYELLIKVYDEIGNESWKHIYAKLANNNQKILFFNQKSSFKAFLSYDINECQVKGKYIEEQEERYSHTFDSKLRKGKNDGLKRALSLSDLNINRNMFSDNVVTKQLNYIIEIDHPYLEKCSIKCNNLIDSLDFYNEIQFIE